MTHAVIIAIGNSDDKLTQAQWSRFWKAVNEQVTYYGCFAGVQVYGRWLSLPSEPYQNAGWSLSFDTGMANLAIDLRNNLAEICHGYRQDSIAWTTGTRLLLPPRPPAPGGQHLPGWSLEDGE